MNKPTNVLYVAKKNISTKYCISQKKSHNTFC